MGACSAPGFRGRAPRDTVHLYYDRAGVYEREGPAAKERFGDADDMIFMKVGGLGCLIGYTSNDVSGVHEKGGEKKGWCDPLETHPTV